MIVALRKIFLGAVLGAWEDYDVVISVFHGNANVGFRRIGVALLLNIAQDLRQILEDGISTPYKKNVYIKN